AVTPTPPREPPSPPPCPTCPTRPSASVCFREPGFRGRGVVAADALAADRARFERQVADRRLRVGLDRGFARGRAAPGRDDEAGTPVQDFLELVVAGDALRMLLAKLDGALEQVLLDLVEQRANRLRQPRHRQALLLARVAPRDHHRRLLDVLRAELEAQRDAAHLPLGELPAGPLFALVERHPDAGRPQPRAGPLRPPPP